MPEPCADCTTLNCRACSGRTWDVERDEPAVCPCWLLHEKEGM